MKDIFLLFLLFISFSCSKSTSDVERDKEIISDIKKLNVSKDFNFETSKYIELELIGNSQFSNKVVEVYEGFYQYGEGIKDNGVNLKYPLNKKLGEYKFDEEGILIRKFEVEASTDIITIMGIIGVKDLYLEIKNGKATYNYNTNEGSLVEYNTNSIISKNISGFNNNFQTLGPWNTYGKPLYKDFTNVNVDSVILEGVNITLAENQNVPQNRPDLIDINGVYNIELSESDGEAWVTFIHEGAGWKNVLAYYTYDIDKGVTKPNSEEIIIAFPNTSFGGSGGDLQRGDRVQLLYKDTNGQFTKIFPKGKGIAWVLLGNWWGTNGSYSGSGNPTNFVQRDTVEYSNKEFNVDNMQQTILLYSSEGASTNGNETIVLAFEDIIRTWSSCDQDFNDAIFQVDVSPFTAIAPSTIKYWKDNNVTVGSKGEVAFYEYSPSQGQYSTLAFEDLWPYEGDYDFNDMVIDYNLALKRNELDKLLSLTLTSKLRAIGATQRNGFYFEIDIPMKYIDTIEINGIEVEKEVYLERGNSGLNPNESTIIKVFQDAHSLFTLNGGFVNTFYEAYIKTPIQNTIKINFLPNVPYSQDFLQSFNPFVRVNSHFNYTDREVHLPGYKPSTFGALSKLNTGDDMASIKGYYKNINGLPWAVKIYRTFEYPIEGVQITLAYNYFFQWASSEGREYTDWYRSDYSGYANSNKLYF